MDAPINSQAPSRAWPTYNTVWRWHFYAGLFCIPFVIVLSLSGAVYLFKTEIEDWEERAYENLPLSGAPASAAEQVRAALASSPGARFSGYELPHTPNSAARVLVRQGEESVCLYVHPQTLQVLGATLERERFMRWIFRLHGELLLGDRGSHLVEIAASWTIVMLLTGLYLWWPRKVRGLGGVFVPRLFQGRKTFWRDLHSVTGVWISAFALFLLISGLPWSKFWGNYFKTVRRVTGTAVARQDWSTGSERAAVRGGEHAEHGGERGGNRGSRSRGADGPDYAALDRVVATAAALQLPRPVIVAPPREKSGDWSVKSMTPNRPQRVNLTVSASGEVTSRENFRDRHYIDRVVGYGIAAHEGRLFGPANQALGMLTATGLVLLSVSGVVMWQRRRSPGTLGAPATRVGWRASIAFVLTVVALVIALPLFGLTLLLTLIVERLLLARIPWVRAWLGLRGAVSAVE